jgi:homoserine dehydrogenase
VRNEFNAVVIESSLADKQFFYGKGAGSLPTASALLSDIAALRYQYKYEYKKLLHHQPHELDNSISLRTYLSFDDIKNVPVDKFEWIEEWHLGEERKYLVGVIKLTELKNGNWWKENANSLILLPEPVVEDVEIRALRKKSLELAGVL